MSLKSLAAMVLVLAIHPFLNQLAAQSPETISLRDRAITATQIYHQIATFYPELSQKQFDQDYADYLAQVTGASDDRRAFDLASMALVATLHDGHTWFSDNWIGQNYGQAIGLTAYPQRGQWVVVRSRLASVSAGDVIVAIDDVPTQQYFERNKKYISASSERDAATSLFDTSVLFPERFTLTLDGGRHVAIDRKHDEKPEQASSTEGRWLVPGVVAYIKLPTFHGFESQAAAIEYLKQYKSAKTVILDVRGNPGAGDPGTLQRSLMDKPYPMWSDHSTMKGGILLREYDIAYPETVHLTTSDATVRRLETAYTGRLLVLIDRGCTCACEDFLMPFKVTKRAQLLGETTAGTFSFTNSTQFENGMRLNITSVRHTFPDGSRFEGVGIAPDIEILPTVQDLKAGKDVVLEKALAVAQQ